MTSITIWSYSTFDAIFFSGTKSIGQKIEGRVVLLHETKKQKGRARLVPAVS